ncbi:hypothetical protein Q9966_007544 [Columba livia]|nr:hypothetical protein Q9966_007544 [Columba livia]
MYKLLLRHHDLAISLNLLRSFLILWKQLEILKAEWGRLKLRTEDINTVPLYKEFCEQQGEQLQDSSGLGCRRAGSQVYKCSMQSKQWIVLLPRAAAGDPDLSISQPFCTQSSLVVMPEIGLSSYCLREESMDILYLAMQVIVRQKGTEEQFGEPISSTQQILPPRGVSETKMKVYQIVGLRHGMIMEITAPRAQLADLEEENLSLKEKMRKEVRDEYESLVQDLFVTCVHLKGNLDVYRLSIEQRLFEIISKVRREGVGNMIDLKKKFGFTKNNGDLKEHLSKEALQSKKEGLNAKLMAEQGVTLFQGELTSIVMLVFTSSRLHSTTLDCTGGFDLKWMARNTVAFNCSTDSKI